MDGNGTKDTNGSHKPSSGRLDALPNDGLPPEHTANPDPFAYLLDAFEEPEGDELPDDLAPSTAPGHARRTSEGIRLADAPGDSDEEATGKVSDDEENDDYSAVNSDMIREATEAAIQDAIAMKRSDSILSTESNEAAMSSTTESDLSIEPEFPSNINKFHQTNRRISNASARYMEEASFEAAMLSPGTDRVSPHGKLRHELSESSGDIVRLQTGSSRRMSINEQEDNESGVWDDMLSASLRRSSERGSFKNTSKLVQDAMPFLNTINSADTDDSLDEEQDENDSSISVLDILRSCGLTVPAGSFPAYPPAEVHLLHLVFKDFCHLPLSLDMVESIFDKEKNKITNVVKLPADVVVETPSPVLFRVIGAPLLRLPREWAMSLFRILLRLLTNETDDEYEVAILTSCSWYNETFGTIPSSVDTMLSRSRTFSTSSLKNQSSFSDQSISGVGNETKKSNQMYSIVRLQQNWKSAVKQVLDTLEMVLRSPSHSYLRGPLTRLLGLLCTSGVSVEELRGIIALATESNVSPMTQLLLVRALRTAAAGASRSLFGKADPRTFFSFTCGLGISRTISLEKSAWPFKNDFGVALWFRIERFREKSTLLRVTNDAGDGTEVSLSPLSRTESGSVAATVLAISILEGSKVVDCVKISKCILHERVWYHVAVRHTRSRLKGVFSLGSREQLSVMLDGKPMATEALKFPHIKESSCKSMALTFGESLDGQTGALYVFHNNVSDATLKALHGITSGINGSPPRRASGYGEWDSRQGEIVKKSKVLDLNMRRDDMEDVVLSYRVVGNDARRFASISDLDEEDESFEGGPLSKSNFNSRLYLVWDPTRTVGSVALELHSGAHARMDPQNVHQWTIEGVQDVLGSLGGIQVILPILRSLLSGDVEAEWSQKPADSDEILQRCLLCSCVPDAFLLFSSLVRDHNENAREMLRCGAIDMLEHSLQYNKQLGSDKTSRLPSTCLVSSACVFPSLAAYLVRALLELRSTCSHYVGLETKVFSRLLYNLPLWFGGPCVGLALYSELLPFLSSVARQFPEKIRDCVGVKGIVKVIIDKVESPQLEQSCERYALFERDIRDLNDLRSPSTADERWHVCEILFAIIFQVLSKGSTVDEIALIIDTLSNYLESEWEAFSAKVSTGNLNSTRSGPREDRYKFSLRAALVVLLLLEAKPAPSGFIRNFTDVCGGAQGCAAWILCTLVNSYCDRIRAIGVRCFVSYLECTGKNADMPLTLEDNPSINESAKLLDSRSIQENTMSLISNVGQGFMNTNVGKGLAAIGPAMKSKMQAASKLTSRVAYKLLWHLLKSHKFRIDTWTQASLVAMVFERKSESSLFLLSFLNDNFVSVDELFDDSLTINWAWLESTMEDTGVSTESSIRGELALNTLLRLLRFLPDRFIDQWLSDLVRISKTNTSAIQALSFTPDWQPCLFQLSSELAEKLAASTASSDRSDSTMSPADPSPQEPQHGPLSSRLDLSLGLHAILLANILRQGEEKALLAVEDAACLQRVCLNGQKIFLLVLTKLFSNLSTFGVLPLEKTAGVAAASEQEEASMLLKRSAKLVTDTILSNTTKGISMTVAVDCWRCLRHLTAAAVAMSTRLGFDAAGLLEEDSRMTKANDSVSGGFYGIRLPDSDIGDISGGQLARFYQLEGRSTEEEHASEKRIDRRISVNLAAQVLYLLDVFIFPESLDVALPASQLHGLALVRNTESRIGSAQGPLLASLVRLSILLLSQLEPCSVSLLQCSSRLRCFLHWIFELVRETEALEGYSAAFNKLTAPFDRLILAVVIHCHQTLGRSRTLLAQLEKWDSDIDFGSKDERKKSYRRLLRVCLELREILVTIMEQRKDVVRACLSFESYEALKDSLDATPGMESTQPNSNSPKEVLVTRLLESRWVNGFNDITRMGEVTIPEILLQEKQGDGERLMSDLISESQDIAGSFEKALNVCFDKYLEAQRKWAETGAVRDLEYEGDTVLKKLSQRHATDLGDFGRIFSMRSQAAEGRWRSVNRKTIELWNESRHWRLARYTDGLGRRIILVRNRYFDNHGQASYELLMGKEREREEKEREERLRKKRELAEVMKRNLEAFAPLTESPENEEEEEKDADEIDDHDEVTVPDSNKNQLNIMAQGGGNFEESEFDATVGGELDDTTIAESKQANDIDAWAKAFIWSENESVVARFDSVMVVTLQYVVEGQLLLTTHGLYFHQTSEEINTVTKDSLADSGLKLLSDQDRRWRLSRLKEVQGRRYMLRAQALELFFSDCHELFLNFPAGHKERNRFYAKLRNSCKLPMLFSPKSLNPRTIYKRSNLTELWRKRRISNFDYIMALNRMAGRTFNDIAQYPVFPWILADYTSEKIDLNDSRVYRDLTKPVGALNPDRLSQLLERYNELEQFGFAENERFLYGSHYSSPGVVLHFLIRQEPFTSMAIDLQSGRFDCPDRLFFDLAESWKSCNTSSSDVKELIPEFFTLPEMFLNSNKFPLGTTQRGHRVDDVGLPPWAKGSAHEFVRIHRVALESEYVSRNLHHWIDLIFGYKQRGPGAEAAHNIFHHLSYEGTVDLDKITDELDRCAAESHIQNFGQTPSQLVVKESHPPRLSADECWVPLINNMSSTVRLRCHTPGKQYGGKKGGCGSAIKISVQADYITVIYSDLKVGTFRWYPKATKNRLKPDRLRALPNRSVSNSRAVIKRGSAAPQTMEDSTNTYAVGNWSFAITLGGYEKEQLRRKALMPSRLASAKDALYTDAASLVVSCGYWDNSIKVHSTEAWKLECVETGGHRGPIRCLAVGRDGGLMVSGGEDCTCRVWVVDHPDMAIALSDGYIQTALGHSTDGEQVISCCHILWGHQAPITCVALSSELDVAVSGSLEGKICVHTLRRGEFVRSIRPPLKGGANQTRAVAVSKLALDKHGRMVVHMSDGRLHTYTVNGVCLCTVDAGERIHDMEITGEVLITGGDRCHVYIRDLVTLKILSGLDLSRHGPVRSLSLTPDELNPVPQHLFIGSDDGMISIVDREDIAAVTGR